MIDPKCEVCGYTGDDLTVSHLAKRINAPSLVQIQCREHALEQDRVLIQAGVPRYRKHTPTDDERAWAMVVGLCGAAEMALRTSSGSASSPSLIEAMRLAPVALGRLTAASADPEARPGPDPMTCQGLTCKAARDRKRRRKLRFCASCGKPLQDRQRRWCGLCRNDPARDERAAERAASESGSTLDGLDRLRIALQLAPMVAAEHPGPNEVHTDGLLQDLTELQGDLHTITQMVGEYPRDVEVAECLTEELLTGLHALCTAAETGSEADGIRAGELLGTLVGKTLRALSELAECPSQAKAHAILDSLGGDHARDRAGTARDGNAL